MPQRILIHYTHKETLGHTTRTISLASALLTKGGKGIKLAILQGGLHQPLVQHPKRCTVLDIPFPFDTKSSFASRPIPHRSAERAAFILNSAKSFAPDVFITEFFPFGRAAYSAELLPTLRHLRQSGCRIIASIGYPFIIDLLKLQDKDYARMYKALLSFYDAFLIHTPEKLETPYFHDTMGSKEVSDLYASTLRSIDKKIIYTGYIFPERALNARPDARLGQFPPAKNTVIVSRGGGAVYPKIIVSAIRAQKLLGKEFRTIIACGPATSNKENAFFKDVLHRYGDKGVFLADHLSDLDEHLRTCQVSVSLSGYNTSVQLMRHRTPAVIIPYQSGPSNMPTNDQIARSRLLQERFNSILLPYETLTPASLAKAVHARAGMPRPAKAPSSWFSGAETSAKIILGRP
jgi:predicted glycosyltransferase